jgi:hypothetical protein
MVRILVLKEKLSTTKYFINVMNKIEKNATHLEHQKGKYLNDSDQDRTFLL